MRQQPTHRRLITSLAADAPSPRAGSPVATGLPQRTRKSRRRDGLSLRLPAGSSRPLRSTGLVQLQVDDDLMVMGMLADRRDKIRAIKKNSLPW